MLQSNRRPSVTLATYGQGPLAQSILDPRSSAEEKFKRKYTLPLHSNLSVYQSELIKEAVK